MTPEQALQSEAKHALASPFVQSDVGGTPLPRPRQSVIAEMAYFIWQARGLEPGSAMDDWLMAERLVDGETVDTDR